MNILLINHYAGSLQHGMEYRPFYLAREWVRRGHSVTIVAASTSHLRTVNPRPERRVEAEEIEGVRYVWIRTPRYSGNGVGRLVNIGWFVASLSAMSSRLARDYRPDWVIASSTYPFDIVPAHSIAARAAAGLAFEVHDLWPLTPIELGGFSRKHPFIVAMQWAEDFAYRKSNVVVSMLPNASAYMQEHGMAGEKFVYVPNGIASWEWGEEAGLLPSEHRVVLDELRRSGRFLVGYAGGHGLSNALVQLLDAAALLKDRPVGFVLVGDGPEKRSLEALAAARGLSNVRFLPAVPKLAVPELLAEMDALYLGWARKAIYRFGICPNKLLDYMMASRPVIHAVEAGNDPVKESGCGVSVPPENPEMLAAAVEGLASRSKEVLMGLGRLGKQFVLANNDYGVLAEKFLASLSAADRWPRSLRNHGRFPEARKVDP